MLVAPALTGFLSDRAVAELVETIEFVVIGPDDPLARGRLKLASVEMTLA